MMTMCAVRSESSTALVLEESVDQSSSTNDAPPILRLRLGTTGGGPRVAWAADVIDNERLDKKKSKCCCIYVKPRQWDESSSEDESDTECDHCHGHVELKKKSQPVGDGADEPDQKGGDKKPFDLGADGEDTEKGQ